MSYDLYHSVLVLQDGTIYRGLSLFNLSNSYGEIVFNTGMTGYQEIISDPSYSGQMVVFTYPEIGNTGLNNLDNESNFIHVKALITKNISFCSSSWRSTLSLRDFILKKQIPHIFGLDTRSLTRHLRSSGVMSASLYSYSSFNDSNKMFLNTLSSIDLARKLTCIHSYVCKFNVFNNLYKSFISSNNNFDNFTRYNIVVLDFGLKFNIIRKLLLMNVNVIVLSAITDYENILNHKPDGILLSNGPGNPMLVNYGVNTVKKLISFSNIPIFGICMGHQILNLALGLNTFKLKFGHRGLNHPSGLKQYSEITSQNHGFAVNNDLSSNVLCNQITSYCNLNDLTLAATFHKSLPVFSVQYHPEASPGPHDSEYLFKIFINLISLTKKAF
uniref:Carbamoyl phosphate synthase small chain n=1 Tax=Tolypiocladia glomerulata TaxID=860646 RepID=A0A1Z1MU85_9FLOR|nr:carbamoyl phosphate synthase small subunit [Tolypiocladia glomerulata]ARW69653.1 carbamoyl phosphate synthase small subunit [Tolypiocladia glomerulata]